MDGGTTVSRGIRYLAQTVGVTVQTIITARRELRKKGFIEHTDPTPGRHNRTTYQLGEMLKSTRHFQSPKRSSELDILGGKKRSNPAREMVKPTIARDRPTKTDKRQNTPTALDTPEFCAAWQEYEQYRQESNLRSLKPRSVQTQWARMASWGSDVAIEAIRRTIANGWQGIFPPLDKGGRKPSGGTSGTASPEHLYKQIKVGKWSCATLADGTTIDLDAVKGWNEGGLTSNNKLILSATAITETNFQ